jgi:hypothetical protein
LTKGFTPCMGEPEGSDDSAEEHAVRMRARVDMQRIVGRSFMLVCLMPALVC